MAIPVVTVILRAIKAAATRGAISSDALKVLATSKKVAQITDAQALLFNRAKSRPSKQIIDALARELGLNFKDVKSLLDAYNQTAEMKRAGLGETFKKELRKSLYSNVSPTARLVIRDLVKLATSEDKIGGKDNNNRYVKSILEQMENMLKMKLEGLLDNKGMASKLIGQIDLTGLFSERDEYTLDNIFLLEQELDAIDADILHYIKDSGDEPLLIEGGDGDAKWTKYSKRAVEEYLRDVRGRVRTALKVEKKKG